MNKVACVDEQALPEYGSIVRSFEERVEIVDGMNWQMWLDWQFRATSQKALNHSGAFESQMASPTEVIKDSSVGDILERYGQD